MAVPAAAGARSGEGHRLTVTARLLLILAGVAACSTAFALVVQERSLSRDLERAARERLDRAAGAADRLVEGHLAALGERYRAISGTPQLRANLELDHPPTLGFLARELALREGAALIAFLDRDGRLTAEGGDEDLRALAEGVEAPAILARAGRAYAATVVPLASGDRPIGRMVAIEPIRDETTTDWSELCGARVAFVPAGSPAQDLSRRVRGLGDLELRVESSLDSERRARRPRRAARERPPGRDRRRRPCLRRDAGAAARVPPAGRGAAAHARDA